MFASKTITNIFTRNDQTFQNHGGMFPQYFIYNDICISNLQLHYINDIAYRQRVNTKDSQER